jgi:hypothetical protein
MTNYELFQLKRYGNAIGADGKLHAVENNETNCMCDENDEFENAFASAEQLNQWFQQQAELKLLEKQQ